LSLAEEYLADHFPEFPVLPGVFMLEAATQAASWLREHLPSTSEPVFLSPGLDLPLLQSTDALAANESRPSLSRRWLAYQSASVAPSSAATERYELRTIPLMTEEERTRLLREPAAYLRDLGKGWIVVEARRTWDWRGMERLRAALGESGELAARFAPDNAERYGDAPIAHQGFDPRPFPVPWFRRILGASCTGSVLEIWKLRR